MPLAVNAVPNLVRWVASRAWPIGRLAQVVRLSRVAPLPAPAQRSPRTCGTLPSSRRVFAARIWSRCRTLITSRRTTASLLSALGARAVSARPRALHSRALPHFTPEPVPPLPSSTFLRTLSMSAAVRSTARAVVIVRRAASNCRRLGSTRRHGGWLSRSSSGGGPCGRGQHGDPPAAGWRPHPKSYQGTPGRTRTCDSRFRKPLLYPLSYGGKWRNYAIL